MRSASSRSRMRLTRSAAVSPARAVHPHVERALGLEAEAALRRRRAGASSTPRSSRIPSGLLAAEVRSRDLAAVVVHEAHAVASNSRDARARAPASRRRGRRPSEAPVGRAARRIAARVAAEAHACRRPRGRPASRRAAPSSRRGGRGMQWLPGAHQIPSSARSRPSSSVKGSFLKSRSSEPLLVPHREVVLQAEDAHLARHGRASRAAVCGIRIRPWRSIVGDLAEEVDAIEEALFRGAASRAPPRASARSRATPASGRGARARR